MVEITFKEIADNIKTPGVYMEIDDKLASTGLTGKESVGLIIGQKLAVGTAEYDRVYTVYSADDAELLGGTGSEIHRQAVKWFDNNDNNVLKIVAVEQTEGQAATYTLTVTAAEAVQSGEVCVLIGGQRAEISIDEGTTAEEIAEALVEAVNAEPLMAFTASVGTENKKQITLTAKHAGTGYNKVPILLNYFDGQKTAAGVSVTIATGKEGNGNASLLNALAVLGDEYFTDGWTNYTDDANIRLLRDMLNDRFTAMQHNSSTMHLPFMGSFSEYITKAASINSMHIVLHPCLETVNMPDEFVAAAAAKIAYRTQVNPGLQYRGLQLKGILPSKKVLNQKEQNLFLNNGVSTVSVSNDGNVYLDRVVTTNTRKSTGQKTENYLDLFVVKLACYLRYSFINHMSAAFPCFKLADDDFDVQEGQEVATPLTITAETIAWAKMCQKAALIEKLESVVTGINSSDPNRADELMRPNLINNLIIHAVKMQHKN